MLSLPFTSLHLKVAEVLFVVVGHHGVLSVEFFGWKFVHHNTRGAVGRKLNDGKPDPKKHGINRSGKSEYNIS